MIARVDRAAIGRPIADRVIRKDLRIEQQGMAGSRQPIQLIIPERLDASSVRETRSVADRVVDIGRLVDRRAGRGELMQDVGDLKRGIMLIRLTRRVYDELTSSILLVAATIYAPSFRNISRID